VATPLGNLEDITFRALKILAEADLVAAEDTRHTLKLLNHYQIKKKLISYFQHNEPERTAELIPQILNGLNIALVSDAGMPGISDPGNILVREAVRQGITVIPIPGPSAVITALAASGLDTGSFRFEGFLPRKSKAQQVKLQEMTTYRGTLIFYESPHRLPDTLRNMAEVFGERRAVLARELTKIHEEFIRGTLPDILDKMNGLEELKGEFTIVVEGCQETEATECFPEQNPVDFSTLNDAIKAIPAGSSLRSGIRAIAKQTGKTTKEIYQMYLEKQERK
jgi:16S rRNA (cytidine1402-2'-O)-methyltransferase